jgi:DNA mismatch repair protein MutS
MAHEFSSLLSADARPDPGAQDQAEPAYACDLRLDQVVEAITSGREESALLARLLYQRVREPGTLHYRHEVFRDLEDPGLLAQARHFAEQLRQVRVRLGQLAKMQSAHQREGWFLDAAAIYCDAVRSLADDLTARPISSRGLRAFRDYLASYAASAEFGRLAADTADRKDDLGRIRYLVRIRDARVVVSRYEDEADYSAEIEKVFERFQQGAVKDYKIKYRSWPGMSHVGAQVVDLVARLFADEFSALGDYCHRHAGFVDATVSQFDRELQFYLAYLDYIGPVRSAGLSFCFPEVTADSKEIFATDTFDLALAARLVASGKPVVTNEFRLRGAERIVVVSGPNQGGKTTFARTFGQLHHLAALGCPVPGSSARLFLGDQIFTHFGREEDIADLTGKLEDDLLRIQQVLRAATPSSIVILNEIFTSTALSDARFLGTKVMDKVIELDALCVYVTFIDELASLGPTVVSMASTIVPANPAERTYKIVRKPADGLAYALAIAEKHRVTHQQLRGRITS